MLHPDLAPELANIDHIIIVMMENHSFDNYFGMLPHHVPGLAGRVDGWPSLAADGRPAATNTTRTAPPIAPSPCPTAARSPTASDPELGRQPHLLAAGR